MLVSDLGGARVSGVIVETEAYLGRYDPAAHAFADRRHKLYIGVWAPENTWYVYRSYGLHWCLNITTPTGDDGAAVLIRAVLPREGIEVIRRRRGNVPDRQLTNGPGKLGQAFAITGEHDGMRAVPDAPLRLAPRPEEFAKPRIAVTPRIGITRATDWPLRFVLQLN